jgi:hypothetical protein
MYTPTFPTLALRIAAGLACHVNVALITKKIIVYVQLAQSSARHNKTRVIGTGRWTSLASSLRF